MKVMLSWTVTPERRDESLKRLKTSGDGNGDGIQILAEWHNVTLLGGWAVVEADSEAALAKFLSQWTDVSINEVFVVTDVDVVRSLI
ncbi:MAG: DUF3303 family protein [Mycobacterium sp.]|nr:DUF3303 family protein [Mycobacterium sp.]